MMVAGSVEDWRVPAMFVASLEVLAVGVVVGLLEVVCADKVVVDGV